MDGHRDRGGLDCDGLPGQPRSVECLGDQLHVGVAASKGAGGGSVHGVSEVLNLDASIFCGAECDRRCGAGGPSDSPRQADPFDRSALRSSIAAQGGCHLFCEPLVVVVCQVWSRHVVTVGGPSSEPMTNPYPRPDTCVRAQSLSLAGHYQVGRPFSGQDKFTSLRSAAVRPTA